MANPKPAYTFRINTPTLRYYDWAQPNRRYLAGNETVAEVDEQRSLRTTWLPGAHAGCPNIQRLHDGDTFVAYGADGLYLKNLYCHGNPLQDELILVSTDWS
jgi:hypothetical protein